MAGVPVRDRLIPELVQRLRAANLHRAANRLETEHEAETLLVGLDVDEREALARLLEDCPPSSPNFAQSCSRSMSGKAQRL